MSDIQYESFLRRQIQEARALVEASEIVRLLPGPGTLPTEFVAFFNARGLIESAPGKIREFGLFSVKITLPPDYLYRAVSHEVLEYAGPHLHPWHPNINPPFICLHLRPGLPLVSLLFALYELWTWSTFSTVHDGLNRSASQWARAQDPGRFPIDRRPLKRRRLNLEVS